MGRASGLSSRVADILDRQSAWFLLAVAVITELLVISMVLMAPDETASDSPGDPVYDLEDSFT